MTARTAVPEAQVRATLERLRADHMQAQPVPRTGRGLAAPCAKLGRCVALWTIPTRPQAVCARHGGAAATFWWAVNASGDASGSSWPESLWDLERAAARRTWRGVFFGKRKAAEHCRESNAPQPFYGLFCGKVYFRLRISRASSGVATSLPNSSMTRRARSTNCTLLSASLPLEYMTLSSMPTRIWPPRATAP